MSKNKTPDNTMLKKRNRSMIFLVLPIYILTLVFVLGPIVYMIVLSFFERKDFFGVSDIVTLQNYKQITVPIYLKTFAESFRLALISTSIIILLGYPFGYFMAKLEKKWANLIMTILTVPFWISALIRMQGWVILLRNNGPINKLLMWLGITSKPLKLLYNYPAVVVGMVYALLPMMIFSVYSSVEKMDWTLVEAARDLGASKMKAFSSITLKLTLPGLLSGVILTFIPSMGLFFIADIFGGNKIVLVGNLIQEQLTKVGNWPFAAALSVVLLILTTLMIFLYRKIAKVDELEGLI